MAGAQLPNFTYHPDPVASGMIVPSDAICPSCGETRGMAYTGSCYGENEVQHETLCPWCIASGRAFEKLGATFVDVYNLQEAGVPPAIVDEIEQRTPGYISWQSEVWLAHCGDACEFHGDATEADVRDVSDSTKTLWLEEYGPDEAFWHEVMDGYRPGGDLGVYKFICRHCGQVQFHSDMS